MITGYRPSYTKLFSTPPEKPKLENDVLYSSVRTRTAQVAPNAHAKGEPRGKKERKKKQVPVLVQFE